MNKKPIFTIRDEKCGECGWVHPKLTKKEISAITILKRLEETFPESLWLFFASGDLHVMKKRDGNMFLHGGVCHGGIVANINIAGDGGDW